MYCRTSFRHQAWSFEIEEQDHGAHGELGTLTVIAVLGAPLVLGLAGWLLKTRNDRTIVAKIRRRYPDGTVEDINFKHVIQNESEPKPELIEALTNAIKLPAT